MHDRESARLQTEAEVQMTLRVQDRGQRARFDEIKRIAGSLLDSADRPYEVARLAVRLEEIAALGDLAEVVDQNLHGMQRNFSEIREREAKAARVSKPRTSRPRPMSRSTGPDRSPEDRRAEGFEGRLEVTT